jgi:hypothetical protein
MGCKRVCGGGIELRSVWAGRSSLTIGKAGGPLAKRTHDHATLGDSLSAAVRSGPGLLFSSVLSMLPQSGGIPSRRCTRAYAYTAPCTCAGLDS